jgi:NTE family protein
MPKITNLVFQGGSVKGSAYEGVIEALGEVNLKYIRRVGGTSAGAITAAVLAMGCSPERIHELSNSLDFRNLLDDNLGNIPTQSKVLDAVSKSEAGKHFFWSKIPAKPIKKPLVYRMYQHKGIYEGEFVRNWIENMIREQVQILTQGQYDGIYLTFDELHELTKEFPGVFRDLSVVGANLTSGEKTVFSYNNPETKDVIISDAIRISMSIPYLFKPHHIYYKVDAERKVETGRDFWSDGGIYDNYPIDIFDDNAFISEGDEPLKQADNGRFYNPQTLGFRLVSGERKAYFEGTHADKKNVKIADGIHKTLKKMLIPTNSVEQEVFYSQPENKERTVYIDHLNISTLAFNLSPKQREDLKLSGWKATHDYLMKYFPELSPHEVTPNEKETSSSYSL